LIVTMARSMATVTLLRGAALVAAPWKNGGGVTREVAAFPGQAGMDSFVWRVSVADVAQAGPFSRFEGVDRTLVLLAGAGMVLDEKVGAQVVKSHALARPLDIARFDGDVHIDARLIDGATRDLNLMVRREAAQGELDVWRSDATPCPPRTFSADVVLLYCASGEVTVRVGDASLHSHSLETGDTLRIDAPDALTCALEGTGAVLAIKLLYTQQ
jgi:environmental stress-induced protein Ves